MGYAHGQWLQPLRHRRKPLHEGQIKSPLFASNPGSCLKELLTEKFRVGLINSKTMITSYQGQVKGQKFQIFQFS